MTYDFKKGPGDFEWVTHEMFVEELKEILANEYAPDLLSIPGIYEVLAEHFNNEILTNLQRHREDEEYDLEEEAAESDPMAEGDECPNCHCGTIEETDDEFRCRGECGSVFRKEPR